MGEKATNSQADPAIGRALIANLQFSIHVRQPEESKDNSLGVPQFAGNMHIQPPSPI